MEMHLDILNKLFFESPNKLKYLNPKFNEHVAVRTAFNIDQVSAPEKSFYPSDKTVSELASAVYDDHPSLEGWTLLTTAFNEGDGYFGAAFLNDDNQQLVIAHRGTNRKQMKAFVNDVLDDIQGIARNQFIPRMNSASTFALRVLEILPAEKILSVSLTGHSLGAWLAQITAFTLEFLTIKNNKFCRKTESDVKYHAHTVGFESPGSKPMLTKLAKLFYFQYQTPPETLLAKLDITNYLTLPNRINCCHEQVGELRQIIVEKLGAGSSIEFLKEMKYLAHYHNMQNIVDAMKIQENNATEVGMGTRLKVLVWPSSRWPERTASNSKIPITFLDDIYAYMKLCSQALILFLDVYVTKSASTELKGDHKKMKRPIDEAEIDGSCAYGIPSKFEVRRMDELRCPLNVFTETEYTFLSNWLLLITKQKIRCNIDFDVEENVMSLESYMQLLPRVDIDENEGIIECRSKLDVNRVVYLVKLLFKMLTPLRAQQLNKDMAEKSETSLTICENESKINVREIEKYDLHFEDTIDLKAFLCSGKEKILVVKCAEQSVLEMSSIYCVLTSELRAEKYWFLSWEQIRRLDDLIYLQRTFESKNDEEDFSIVLDCRNEMSKDDDNFLTSLRENLRCKLILAVNSDSQILENNNEEIKIVNCQLKFSNLSFESKARLNETIVMGVEDERCSLKLKQLLDDEGKDALSLKTIEKLSRNEAKLENFNIEVDNFHTFFVEINEKVVVGKFKEIVSKDDESIFIVSDKRDENSEDLLEIFNENKEKLTLYIEKYDDRISEKFKDLCKKYSTTCKNIFWLQLIDSQELNLRRVYRKDLYTPTNLRKNTKLNRKSFFKFLSKIDTEDQFIFAINPEKIELKNPEKFSSNFDLDSILSKQLKKQFNEKFDKSVFYCDENEALTKFNELINANITNKSVHWIQIRGEAELYWHESHGAIHRLTPHLEPDEAESSSELTTRDLSNERFVVICDEPGMGKSTSLSKFTEDLAKDYWVFNLDLAAHQPQLQSLSVENFNDIVSLIVDTFNSEFKDLLAQILLCSLRKPQFKKIIFLFDGFDELSKDGRAKMLRILKILKDESESKIWITTRYEHKNVLEDCLSVLSVKFIKFSKDKQIEYLVKFWRCCLHFNGINEVLLASYANEVLAAAEKSLGEEIPNFLGNPLHIRMVAEVVWSLFKRPMCAQYASLELSENFKFQNFFQQFIKIKYDTYLQRQNVAHCDHLVAYSVRSMLEKHFRNAAVRLLFPAEAKDIFGVEDVRARDEVMSGLVKVGLIVVHSSTAQQLQLQQPPQFIYRVLAEYFVVDFLFYWLNKFRHQHRNFESAANFLINTILLEKEYRIIRQFINYTLLSDFEKYKYILMRR